MVLTAPPTVVEVTRSVEERQYDGDDASARLAGEFLPRGDGNPAQLAVRRRRVFCSCVTGNKYRWKLHLPKDYFVTAPPPPPGEFVVSPLDPSSERGPCAPPRGPFLKICFFRYTRLHTSRVRALETASFTLEGAAATCEETAMDETMVVLLTHGARQVERALRRALHCPQQHSKLPAPHLLALVP